MDYSSKTVLELRKIAKANGVKLSAGINKAEIIARLQSHLDTETEEQQLTMLDSPDEMLPVQAAEPAGEDEGKEAEKEEGAPAPEVPQAKNGERKPLGTTRFKASWHNQAPAGAGKFRDQGGYGQSRASWNQNAAPQGGAMPKKTAVPPVAGPRFGPSSGGFGPQAQGTGFGPQAAPAAFGPQAAPPAFGPQGNAAHSEPAAPAYAKDEPLPRNAGFGPQTRTELPHGSYTARTPRGFNEGRDRQFRSAYGDTARRETADTSKLPVLQDLIQPEALAVGSGVLEVLPDGYGFLRGAGLLPSSRDIYVAMPLIRRYELRSGDEVSGRLRPLRDGDKYSALLYVDTVNGMPSEGMAPRPFFDELTAVYSQQRLRLDDPDYPGIRLIDLLTPIGLGTRTLILFPPDTGKTRILQDLARAIRSQNDNVEVLYLLVDYPPEEVTALKDAVPCSVLATTFDMTPDMQMRLIDLAQERVHRLGEQGKDAVLIVDSLTRIVKIYAAAAQQARQNVGSISPSSLFRAKKLFGAARCTREGGTLTVIAAMDIESGVKLDDSIVEEFRSTANTEIQMDASLARLGVFPPVHFQRSRTRREDLLLSEAEMEGQNALRGIIASGSPASAIQQLNGLIEKVTHNADILAKIKGWSALMAGGKAK